MLLTARHVKTWVDRFGAALDTLHVVDAKAFGLPPDKVPNVLLRRTADLKHYCDYYFGGTVVPGKQSPTVFIIAGGWSAFRKQSKLPYSRDTSRKGILGPWGAMEQWMQLRFTVRRIGITRRRF